MIATSIEQSKRLLELGIKPETADMAWIEDFCGYDREGNREYGKYRLYGDKLIPAFGQCSLPAWSLTALLELIPDIKFSPYESSYFPCVAKYGKGWMCKYSNEDTYKHRCINENPIDATVEMIEWLVENKYITGLK